MRFAYETRAATLLIDPFGQGCAGAAWFRNSAAHSPERLEPCQTPRETRGSKRLGRVYPLDLKRPHTRSPDLLRDTHVNGASAPVELDCQLGSDLATRRASGQRCFRPTRALHVVKDEHPDCVWLSTCSRLVNEALASRP